MSIRGCEMRMTVIPFLNAMARGSGVSSPAPAAIRVPGAEGLSVLRMKTGMPRSTAGLMVAGCSTLAPK